MSVKLSVSDNQGFLIFVRHGETDWNREERMQGQTDIPLNELGRRQASDNGARLKTHLEREGIDPIGFDYVASPLMRTRETMERLRGGIGLQPSDYRTDPRLKELTFGSWEGYTMDELIELEPELVDLRRNDKYHFVAPGGGESYAMLRDRVAHWLAEVHRPTVCVAHGGVMRVLRGMLESMPEQVQAKLDVPQDKVFIWKDGHVGWI